ncbi:MAG: hypothetical protein OXE98_07765, partial [Hyphomicrobiales bacterium]|nr:hypothetical protein [Hyphomicrobiales bacterium]
YVDVRGVLPDLSLDRQGGVAGELRGLRGFLLREDERDENENHDRNPGEHEKRAGSALDPKGFWRKVRRRGKFTGEISAGGKVSAGEGFLAKHGYRFSLSLRGPVSAAKEDMLFPQPNQ